MLAKIFMWCKSNEMQMTWFIIGFLTFATIDALVQGNYIMAAVNAALVAINYCLRPRSV